MTRARCRCGYVGRAFVPRGGDGSLEVMVRHKGPDGSPHYYFEALPIEAERRDA